MTAVTNDNSIRSLNRGHPCSVCGDGIYRYPYMVWDGNQDIVICGSCVQKIKRGFIADMIQVAAICDMHDNGTPYDETLQRVHIKEKQSLPHIRQV